MAKIVFGIIAVVAYFMLAESLTCNQCSYGIAGFCVSNSEVNCTTNTSQCFTGKATFTGFTSIGFNSQGCMESAKCNKTTNDTIIGISYTTKVECCSTDKCNPVQISGAPSTKMTLTAALGVAVLASLMGSL